MDSDEICFFELIDLNEGSGYTSVDYLYYKRKDSLVVIQQESDVMEMLNECESEKTVNLFVTRQRLSTLAPAKSNIEPSKSKPKKIKVLEWTYNLLFYVYLIIQGQLFQVMLVINDLFSSKISISNPTVVCDLINTILIV